VTESQAPRSKPTAKAAVKPAPKASAKAAGKSAVAVVVAPKPNDVQVFRHPNLGLAPVDMAGAHAAAAAKIRGEAAVLSAGALEAAVKADPTIRARYDDAALRQLLRDVELLTVRLALCLDSGQDRWITGYAEWIGPIQRRRGVPLADLATLCTWLREQLEPTLSPNEFAAATRSLDAAAAIFNRNGRVGGDRHRRNALLKWMYKGV
jgi:hypothetical protein